MVKCSNFYNVIKTSKNFAAIFSPNTVTKSLIRQNKKMGQIKLNIINPFRYQLIFFGLHNPLQKADVLFVLLISI